MSNNKKPTVQVVIAPELKKKIEELAKAEHRSVSNWVGTAISFYLDSINS